MEQLVERVAGLWTAIGAREDPAVATHRFVRLYTTPKRHYHNLSHILVSLETLRRFRYAAQDENLIATALWFHDCVYDVSRHDNEERSAQVAYDALTGAGVDCGFSERVAGMVLATKDHRSEDPDTRLLIDIDMSILGVPLWRDFEKYERKIRLERAMYSDEQYRMRRKAFLERLLDPGRTIYLTKPFQQVFEGFARENIRRSIERL